jgi:sulfate permease, SulP family
MKRIRQYAGSASLEHRLLPFLRWWHFIGWDTLRADLLAGLTGAVIVLPQGVAFAMIAGLPPEYGLYTAIVPPIIAALFGSSLHLISGPTTAISIIVFTAISPLAAPGSPEFIRLTLTLTFLAGIYQLAFGLARMGTLVNFVSHSVVVGFTAGAAILIATSQMKHVLGIDLPKGSSFIGTLYHIGGAVDQINPRAAGVALAALLCALLFKLWRPHWPGLLFALITGSLVSLALAGAEHGVSLLGKMPDRLPPLSLPDFSPQTLHDLAPKALAVALLGLIEALSIGRSIAAQSRQQIDGNQEFIGQGLSNVVGSFFSCYAASGSFTRSGINYHAGAMTPLAAVFAALFLTLLLLLVAPLTAFLPIPAMGGVILLVAYNLINLHHISTIVRTSKQETGVLLTTFLATVFLDLEFAIFAGVLLSLVLYLGMTAHPLIVHLMPNPNQRGPELIEATMTCPNFTILRIDGPLFFGAVHHVADYLYNIDKRATSKRHVLIVGCGINFIDVAGAQLLNYESQRRSRLRGGLYLCDLRQQVKDLLGRGRYIDSIGDDHIFATVSEAKAQILSRIDCGDCTQYPSPRLHLCPMRHPGGTAPV